MTVTNMIRWCLPGAIGLFLMSGPVALASACPTQGTEEVRVVGVDPRLEVRLADGRIVRLVGIDPPGPTPTQGDLAETVSAGVAADLRDRPLQLRLLSERPDRWGRRAGILYRGAENLAVQLIASGKARYLAEPSVAPCRDTFLAAEDKARRARLGVWQDPYYAVLDVDDRAAFAEKSGTIVVAEGRLVAVEPGTFRTTLRFAAPTHTHGQRSSGGRSLVASFSPRAMKASPALAARLHDLVGHRLRMRGLLDLRFGPHLDLDGPDSIEALPDPAPDSTH